MQHVLVVVVSSFVAHQQRDEDQTLCRELRNERMNNGFLHQNHADATDCSDNVDVS
jgi:hypothetical protein